MQSLDGVLRTIWSINTLELGAPVWLIRILPSSSAMGRLYSMTSQGEWMCTMYIPARVCMQFFSLAPRPEDGEALRLSGWSGMYSNDVG